MTKVDDLSLARYFDAHVFCCLNQRIKGHSRGSCQDRGAVALRNYLKTRAKEAGLGRVRINGSQCLDRCELGPVMVIYPEGVWYTYHTREDVDEILERHLIGGEVVDRLLLRPEDGPKAAD
ncbi:MAG: (2Fe-2S) ferredoxin domain-containing protein [Sphingomonadales bacterium]